MRFKCTAKCQQLLKLSQVGKGHRVDEADQRAVQTPGWRHMCTCKQGRKQVRERRQKCQRVIRNTLNVVAAQPSAAHITKCLTRSATNSV